MNPARHGDGYFGYRDVSLLDIRRVYGVRALCDELADLNDASRPLIEAAHRV
jgi:hypothetical protein